MKILWLTNIPSPYRVDFFNELGKHLELNVLFERKTSTERDESWKQYEFNNFKGVFLKGLPWGKDKAVAVDTLKHILKKDYDHIVISNPFTPTGMFTIKLLQLMKKKYFIVSDGGIAEKGDNFKEKIKKNILKGANLYFSTAKIHDNYYLKYGAVQEKIVRYPFTSLKKDDILTRPLTQEEKEKLKKDLGISGEKIILSVGRFTLEKGHDLLIKASEKLDSNVQVYIVGGSITEEYSAKIKGMCLKNIHFIEFKDKETLFKYYKLANLFVLPTRGDVWGLVINEAMANGLPVITTNKCVAGLELIDDYENGFIVPTESSDELFEKINFLINSQNTLSKMSQNNLKKIKSYNIEEMAIRHVELMKIR